MEDKPKTKATVKSVFLEKYDGDPQPGDMPVEMLEINYSPDESVSSFARHTEADAIKQCLQRRAAAEGNTDGSH